MNPYSLRPARSEQDEAEVWALLAETVAWLRSKGSDQWSTWKTWIGPGGKVTRALESGNVWILRDGETTIGTITVENNGDPDFWTPEELAESALYVSKLAVRRAYSGRRVGTLLLSWARDRALQTGGAWVRLDAWRTNPELLLYYVRNGWTFVRDVKRPNRNSGALFQLPATTLSDVDRAKLTVIDDAPKPTALPN